MLSGRCPAAVPNVTPVEADDLADPQVAGIGHLDEDAVVARIRRPTSTSEMMRFAIAAPRLPSERTLMVMPALNDVHGRRS
jgi:hypothetical protein